MLTKLIPMTLIIYISFIFLSCASVEARAAAEGDLVSLTSYLAEGGNIEAPQSWGRTLLMIAAESNQLDVIEYLLNHGANPESIGENGRTALISASLRGRYEIVEYLIQRGVDVNKRGRNDSNALHYAAQNNKYNIVRLLIESGGDYNQINKFGWTAILYALDDSAEKDKGISTSAEYLLASGSRLDIKSQHIEDIAFLSAESGNLDVLKLLFSYGFNLDVKDIWRNSLIFQAVKHPHVLSFLIDRGLSVNEKNSDGHTPLFVALNNRSFDSISLFLNNGANPDITDRKGKSLLIEAADLQMPKLVRQLIIAGANPCMVDYSGNNALHYAALAGDPETVRLLLIAGLDPNQVNGDGFSPLTLAELNEEFSLQIIDLLVAAGAEKFD